jgi:hypothetical protein
MTTLRWWACACALLCGLAPPLRADGTPNRKPRDVAAVAARIDELVAKGWADAGIEPAPVADDAEFLRRLHLDVAGRIPAVSEVRAFLADPRPDKRQREVERLLTGPRYVNHWARVWRGLLLPEADLSLQGRALAPGFEGWVRQQLLADVPYDKMVRELITTPIQAGGQRARPIPANQGQANAGAFFQAKEFLPENLAASTARLFLGVNVGCAQCHNHPFADWKREQFWSFAAFYAGIRPQRRGDFVVPGPEDMANRRIQLPGSDRILDARFLDGRVPQWKEGANPREVLADWITSADNPFFARATVNRLWSYFFGLGLIEPVDEMVGAEVSGHHPELIDELAREFIAHGYDLKFLVRTITATKAYQLSSLRRNEAQEQKQRFACMPLRGLSAEQLFDSLVVATGFRDNNGLPPGVVGRGGQGGVRGEFLGKFANSSDRPIDVQTSILQALSLMNGRLITEATDLARSETLAAVLDAPFLDTPARVETLYLAALGRKPRSRELERAQRYIDQRVGQGQGAQDQRYAEALADVFWALLNSSEFFLNH